MKTRIMAACMAIAAFIMTSCSTMYDDTALTDRVDQLADRVAKLEEMAAKANNEIGSIQTIVSNLENNVYVNRIESFTGSNGQKGHKVIFTDDSSIEIMDGTDGKDGHTPQIGVKKDTDGIYYWTVDGEYIRDNGMKLPVKGRDGIDGNDGTAPQLRINASTKIWEISTDNGYTWNSTGIVAEGKKGEKGDSYFSDIVDNGESVDFILSTGETITLPKGSLFAINLSAVKVGISNAETVEVTYTLQGETEGCFVEAYAKDGYTVTVDEAARIIRITAPVTFTESTVTVVYSNGKSKTVIARIRLMDKGSASAVTISTLNRIQERTQLQEVTLKDVNVVSALGKGAILTDAGGEYFYVYGDISAKVAADDIVDITALPSCDKFGMIMFSTNDHPKFTVTGHAPAPATTYTPWKASDVETFVGNQSCDPNSTQVLYRCVPVELEGTFAIKNGSHELVLENNVIDGRTFHVDMKTDKGLQADPSLAEGASLKVRGFAIGVNTNNTNRILNLYVTSIEETVPEVPQVLIDKAPLLANTFLYPMWKNHGTLPSVVNSLNNMSQFTMECLVNFGAFTPQIQTIMGIENLFLLRVSDGGEMIDPNQLEIVVRDVNGDPQRLNEMMASFESIDRWYHLAVAADLLSGNIKCYIDGGLAAEYSGNFVNAVNFWTDFEEDAKLPYSFFIGRSYDNNRPFQGLMSEVRIWNRCLNKTEINAKNHFYTVENPEAEENLLAYWKLNEGTGTEFKDHSRFHNNLQCQTAPAQWIPVQLPDNNKKQ